MGEKAPWAPRRSETEHHKTLARTFYDFETECRVQGWGDPAFVYDEKRDLFHWTDAAASPFPASTRTGIS